MGDRAPESSKGKYGVRLIRGPFVQLPPHPEECGDERPSWPTRRDFARRGTA